MFRSNLPRKDRPPDTLTFLRFQGLGAWRILTSKTIFSSLGRSSNTSSLYRLVFQYYLRNTSHRHSLHTLSPFPPVCRYVITDTLDSQVFSYTHASKSKVQTLKLCKKTSLMAHFTFFTFLPTSNYTLQLVSP